ncbi:hypothetical protein [Shewanella waksmanii]|uniref:hypothetical protein n=1 Tax=Shewanella waksmanii TaxID=213783 RepID=UPI003736623D
MLVVTNYPQVPIATTNAATDAARVDSQQRPPIIPTQEATKGHEERAFNSQNERAAEQANAQAKINERLQGKQQGSGQQQQEGKQQQEQKPAALPAIIKAALRGKPALQRRDIRSYQQTPQPKATNAQMSKLLVDQSQEFYQAVARHVSEFYQLQTQPKPEPNLSSAV